MAEKERKTWKILGFILLAVILGGALFIFSKYIDVLIASLAMAYISYPVARFLARNDTRRGWKYLIISFVAVLIVAVPVLLSFFYSLNFSLKWLIHNLPVIESGTLVTQLKATFAKFGLGIFSERIANESSILVRKFAISLSTQVLSPSWITGIIVKILLFFITSFYFVYEGPQFKRFIDTHVGKKDVFLKELIFSFNKICYSLFVSHLFTSLIVTTIAMAGFWVFLKPPLVLLGILGTIMFIVAFLPVIGPWLVYIPLGLWQIAVVPGGYTNGIALIVFGIIFLTIIPDLYIRPKLVSQGSEIHPLLFILGFFGGELVFGLKGVIIGPLMLGLAQGIVMLYVRKRHILQELIEHF
ncbi:TPA: AI-2E family transporter [archaeon]|nr:AI-2E family transporter [Candidatus Naiadarchaeales archaeon SRR2090153.bin461]